MTDYAWVNAAPRVQPFTPTPTDYRGRELKSRLEGSAAAYLDDLFSQEFGCDVWAEGWLTYEPRAYANREHNYLPDFEVIVPSGPHAGERTFIEVKPDYLTQDEIDGWLRRMHCIRASHPSADLAVIVGTWVGDGHEFAHYQCCAYDPSHPVPELLCCDCRDEHPVQALINEARLAGLDLRLRDGGLVQVGGSLEIRERFRPELVKHREEVRAFLFAEIL